MTEILPCGECRFCLPYPDFDGLFTCHQAPPTATEWVLTKLADGKLNLSCGSAFPPVYPDNPNYGCAQGQRKPTLKVTRAQGHKARKTR